jgi:hypothetical protein
VKREENNTVEWLQKSEGKYYKKNMNKKSPLLENENFK